MSKIMYNDRPYGEIYNGPVFSGTDGTTDGSVGLVPAPSTTDRNKYLKSDGTWAVPAGGGAGGTSDYEELINLPSINNHTLLGSMSLSQLGLIDFFYPIGSYYETSDADFDPSTEWGGTWTLVSSNDAYIVEEGSNTNWTYRKWSDGTAERWGRFAKTLSANSVDTSTYIDYPFTFTATPCAVVSTNAGGANNYLARQLSDGSTASRIRLFFANTYSGQTTIYAHAYVIGKWSSTSEAYYRWHRTA